MSTAHAATRVRHRVAPLPPALRPVTAIDATVAATEKVKQRMVTANDIRVVDATTVIGADNEMTVKTKLDTHKDHVTALRTAIGTNPAYTAALAAHKDKPLASDVIAVDILADGDVIV